MVADLSGRAALIVGAGGGFGGAIAERLAANGVAVALAGRNPGPLEAVAERVLSQGGRASVVCGDMLNAVDVARVCEEAARKLGPPTILVDAAAVPGPFGPVNQLDPEEWWTAMTLHVKTPMILFHHLLPDMLRLRSGHLIVLASLIGKTVFPYLSAYSVGKGAQVALVAHAAAEHRDTGVSFFAIQPGFALTKMTQQTLASSDFQKWAPQAVQRMEHLVATVDHDAVLRACGERCAQLASGRYDQLTGRYLEPDDDLERLLEAGE